MAAKTKAELIEELNRANETIKSLKAELEEAEVLEKVYAEATKAAKQLKVIVDAFAENGFTREQAIAFITTSMNNGGILR